MQTTEKIWRNGTFVAWEDAHVHVLTHALHYGTGVFEGIRAYATPKGTAVFRLTPHLERLRRSAALYEMDLGIPVPELAAAVHDTIAANGVGSCYVRPIVFRGYGEMGLFALNNPVDVVDRGVAVGRLPGRGGARDGRALQGLELPPLRTQHAAAGGQGVGPVHQLGAGQASRPPRAGYDEAILLNEQGFVADGSGENVFVVRDGVLHTPPTSDSCLPGITRDSVIRIARVAGARGARDDAGAHRPLLRRRGVPVRHRRRGDADRVGGRPGDRRPRPRHREIQDVFFATVEGRRRALRRVPRVSGDCAGGVVVRFGTSTSRPW